MTFDYPIIKRLSGRFAIVAHPNGPAICDGDFICVIDPQMDDSEQLTDLKREAVTAYLEWSWPLVRDRAVEGAQ